MRCVVYMNYYGLIYEGELNGKLYVGQHIGMDVETTRWKAHLRPSSGCRYFRNAIQLYGKKNVVWRIICYCKVGGQGRLDALERYFIKKRKSLAPNGYNLDKGGRGGKMNDLTKQLIAEVQKISVNQYSKDEKFIKTWKSIKEAESTLKLCGVNDVCRGKRGHQTAGGFIWKYNFIGRQPKPFIKHIKEPKKLTQEHIENVRKAKLGKKMSESAKANMRKPKSIGHKIGKWQLGRKLPPEHIKNMAKAKQKKVNQYSLQGDFIKTWNSVREAQASIKTTHISMVCSGKPKYKTAGGFKWKYADEKNPA